MNAQFWLNKWQKNEIGFHLPKPHPWLVALWPEINAQTSVLHVFLPLCGKTCDVDFFLAQGRAVTANELSEDAVKAIYERLAIKPQVSNWAGGKRYHAKNLTIYAGDFFQLTPSELINVDWVYDRAALIALPATMRSQYTRHLMQLCPKAQQCLITLDYQQDLMSGPPFALSYEEVKQHYAATHSINELKSANIIEHEPRFAQNGLPELFQRVYQLTPKPNA
ncbi:thiopurine S-methyltransferase [Pseudomonas sp. HK3]